MTQTQAITRCPACGMSFRVSETQLRVADGAVRCGACLHVFQAEDYFISPMLDATERIAIQQEYWADFDEYLYQIFPAALEADATEEEVAADTESDKLSEETTTLGEVFLYERFDDTDSPVDDDASDDDGDVAPEPETGFVVSTSPDALNDVESNLPAAESFEDDGPIESDTSTDNDEMEEVVEAESEQDSPSIEAEVPSDDLNEPVYDPDDLVPVLNEEISPEEFEEAFAAYADVGLEPIDTVEPEGIGQQDLFALNDKPADDKQEDQFELLAGMPSFLPETRSETETEQETEQGDSSGTDESLMDFYLDYLDHHPGKAVESPETVEPIDHTDQTVEIPTTGLTIIETRDESIESELDGLAIDIADDPDELTAPRTGGITNAMIGWFAASLGLVGIAFLQYVFFSMDIYAQEERYRPWYISACRYLGCELPEYDKIELLRTRELIVRTHPSESDALTVDVLLSNNGDFRQLFPGLKLTFFDLDGEQTASRVFTVSEYLGGELRGLRFIPARTEVRLSLELVDPGNEALGYEMQVVPL